MSADRLARPLGIVALVVGLALGTTLVAGAGPAVAGDLQSVDAPEEGALASDANETVCVVVFYSPSCPHCDNVEKYVAAHDRVHVVKYQATENVGRFKEYLQAYDVPQNQWGAVPTVFVGEEYAIGDKPAISLIEKRLDAGQSVACPPELGLVSDGGPTSTGGETTTPTDHTTTAPGAANAGLGGTTGDGTHLTLLGIVNLALVDAVNPCALAVLVVLLTAILTHDPSQTRRALLSGLAFAGAILVAYLTMGTALVFGIKSVLAVTSLELAWLYRLFGLFAIVLGVLNLKDWLAYGAGGFAVEVPFSWRPKMKSIIREATSPIGAFVAGLIVSLFLLPCTSGPYFVAGGLLASLSWADALPWLVLYNLVFVAPMVVITVAVSGGFVSVDRVSEWRDEQIERLHLVAGLVLIALGIALVAGLL
jgi:cytochrome c biogenesis protein CcdA